MGVFIELIAQLKDAIEIIQVTQVIH
jgi:hypothetical protein